MKHLLPFLFLGFLVLFLLFPNVILVCGEDAINTWAKFVLPALLPFFILNRLCVSYGAIDLMAKILAPFTEKVFRLPRETAYVIATGYTTGAPLSSTTIAHLRNTHSINEKTGNFLLPFTSNVSPLFLFSVVAGGFLGRPDLSLALALIHYGTNFILGFFSFRFLVRNDVKLFQKPSKAKVTYPPLGQGIADSVSGGIATITLICGIMILAFILIGFADYFQFFSLVPQESFQAFISGIIEITAGIKCTAAMNHNLWAKLPLISGILAFGGFSAVLQIATQIKDTDLSLKTYLIYKGIQGLLAALITIVYPFSEKVSTTPVVIEGNFSESIYFTLLFLYGFILLASCIIHRPQHRKSRKKKSFCR